MEENDKEKENPSTLESYESRLALLKKEAEKTGDYTEYSKLAPTDYYSESIYEIMEMNRIHRKIAQYKREHGIEYWEAYKYVMIEITPVWFKEKYIKYLSKQKINQPEFYRKEMARQNNLRPVGTPKYKNPEDIQYYMNWISLAEYRTRQWLFKKRFCSSRF